MDTKEVINMFVFLCIDSMMVLLYLIIGIIFIKSNGRAIRYLTGHDLDENISNKSKEDDSQDLSARPNKGMGRLRPLPDDDER